MGAGGGRSFGVCLGAGYVCARVRMCVYVCTCSMGTCLHAYMRICIRSLVSACF